MRSSENDNENAMLDCLYTHQFVGQFVRISIGTFAWDPPTRISVFTRNSNDVCWVLCTPTHASRCNAVPVVSSCIKENKNKKGNTRFGCVFFFSLLSFPSFFRFIYKTMNDTTAMARSHFSFSQENNEQSTLHSIRLHSCMCTNFIRFVNSD